MEGLKTIPKKEKSEEKEALPSALATMFPRSPAWRILSSGEPCVSFFGLKCGPTYAIQFKKQILLTSLAEPNHGLVTQNRNQDL